MAQRPLDVYASSSETQRARIDSWLARIGAPGALDLAIEYPLERHQFKLRLQQP